jgi:hypothetical protein
LAAAAFTAAIVGVLLALPAPFAASALGAITLGAAFLHARFKDMVWRIGAIVAAILTAYVASNSVPLVLEEAPIWTSALIVVTGLALPAALTGFAGSLLRRAGARASGGVAKLAAVGLSVATADMVLRLVFSNGAPLMQPIGFVEAGFHIAAWLAIALAVAARGRERRMSAARKGGVLVLGACALAASTFIAALWLTPYWQMLPPARVAWSALRWDGLGFLAPAALFWAHWAFWRSRGSNLRTRTSFAAAAALTASAITFVVHPGAPGSPGGLSTLIAAAAFALAVVLNFAPGIVAASARRSHL